MIDMLLSRSNFGYFMMLIVNPIVILCFQNCSVVKLSDLKTQSAATTAITAPTSSPLHK